MKTRSAAVLGLFALLGIWLIAFEPRAAAQEAPKLSCADFPNQAAAQAYYAANPLLFQAVQQSVDPDGDRRACEQLTGPYDFDPVVQLDVREHQWSIREKIGFNAAVLACIGLVLAHWWSKRSKAYQRRPYLR